ncbi:XylR N-terminal domain-containing protein [Paracoccus tibetensis]|uniref:Regulatory protein, Fis family n=1 Tax=Paracoccus tibetensis TaxID=336292 RepID=A0A1G5K6W8_9RHOB|nr:XylR N-terminal domain-containing protein [Paracoccus tibetensis]SCY95810.1 regulatory protein, Fis family [Paracoccus tibetensis]
MKIPIKFDLMTDRGAKPSVRELLASVNFNPAKGTIDLGGARIIMQRANVGHIMRDELRALLGEEETRVFLLRQGYLAGRADADFMRQTWPTLDIGDAFTAGTRLHTFTGTVRVETVHNDFDFRRGRFSGSFIWHDSIEALPIAEKGLRTADPCCWTLVGYASGYASAFFGKPILYKETTCIAQGKDHCRVVGKPLEEWPADDPAVIRFRDRVLARETGAPRPAPPARARAAAADPVAAPVQDALQLRALAGLPCILIGPEDSGRRHAIEAVLCPGTEPDWLDGADLTLARLETAREAGKAPLLIDGVDLCAPQVQRRLGQGRIAFHGTATTPLSQLRADPRILSAFFGLLAVGAVAMPAFGSRPEADRRAVVEAIALRLARQMRARAPDEAVLARLARSGALAGLSQVTGALRHLMLTDEGPEAALAAVTRPPADPHADPRLTSWIADALAGDGLNLDALEAQVRHAALATEGGNLAAAARKLGLTRAQLAYRMKADGAPS